MRNIQEFDNQRIKGYLVRGNKKVAFWYRETFTKDISENFGQPVADGQRSLITESTLDFRINDQLEIAGQKLLVDNVQLELKGNLNSLRGAPSYIKTIVVR